MIAKQVITAERKDGRTLEADHLRLVGPGDGRGGRSVHEVVRIMVNANGP